MPVLALLLCFGLLAPVTARAAAVDTLLHVVGREQDDWLGVSVAGAGDVNGDGFADLVVGAYANNDGGLDAGRMDIFFGGPHPDTTADVTDIGVREDYFGTSVASAGDMNGDGYDDVIVGSPANDAVLPNGGSVYVYFGGPVMDAVPDLVLRSEGAEDYFGQSVAGAGDVNGDGYDDVIVGAWKNDFAGADAGRAYVYFGGPVPDSIADWVLTGEAELDNFGFMVAGAGDVNGDRFADLVIGAPYQDGSGYNAGRAYLFLGGATPDSIPDRVFDGEGDFHNFGFSVAGAGDVDGDGFADLVVGAIFAGASNAGRAYVFRGGASMDTVADLVLDGEMSLDSFGFAVAGAGDVDGDGYGDVLVGANHSDAAGRESGRAYLYRGGTTLDWMPDLVMTGGTELDDLGFTLGAAGDINGDGRLDFAIGAPLADVGGVRRGLADVYSLDAITPALLSWFHAEASAAAIEIRWRWAPGAPASAVTLERADAREGPWRECAAAMVRTGDGFVAADRDVIPGRSYFYRLAARGPEGVSIFGPIEARAAGVAERLALVAVFPNPARDRVTIELTTPRAARLEIALYDLQGRRVADLARGSFAAGRHRVDLALGGVAPRASGLYWLALSGPGGRVFRRLSVQR